LRMPAMPFDAGKVAAALKRIIAFNGESVKAAIFVSVLLATIAAFATLASLEDVIRADANVFCCPATIREEPRLVSRARQPGRASGEFENKRCQPLACLNFRLEDA